MLHVFTPTSVEREIIASAQTKITFLYTNATSKNIIMFKLINILNSSVISQPWGLGPTNGLSKHPRGLKDDLKIFQLIN